MTHNQIAYWELKERERANRVQEQETHRANVARESHNQMKLKHDRDVLTWDRQKFDRSNWHTAIKNVGSVLGGASKLFGLMLK